MKYYSVQVTCRKEVCVLASDEDAAVRIARDASVNWDGCCVRDAEAEECYNAGDENDADCIESFKRYGDFFPA